MTGEGYGKKLLGKANVYIHEKGKSNARITHIDIELDELNKIVKQEKQVMFRERREEFLLA